MKKRYVTMLETLIALSIAMIILSTLTYFYRQIVAINSEVEKVQNESFRMRYVENRLAAVLPNAVSETDEKRDFFFFTSGSTLFFTYDNGNKLEKIFSNNVLGRLYLDAHGNLCLATWPSPNRWPEGVNPPMKKEVLFEGVSSLQFGFFVAPDRDWQLAKSPKQAAKPTPEGEWLPNWSSEYEQLPAMVRLQLTLKNGKTRRFVFPLPKCQRQVVYK